MAILNKLCHCVHCIRVLGSGYGYLLHSKIMTVVTVPTTHNALYWSASHRPTTSPHYWNDATGETYMLNKRIVLIALVTMLAAAVAMPFAYAQDGPTLTTVIDDGFGYAIDSWSPDGTQLLVESTRDGGEHWDLYMMDLDGTNVEQLTDADTEDGNALWSPDGRYIVYSQFNNDNGESDIVLIDLEEDSATVYPTEGLHEAPLAWTEDSTQFYVQVRAGGTRLLVLMDLDGTYNTEINTDVGCNSTPSLSPDFTQMVCHARMGEDDEIVVMNLDGSDMLQLTDNDANDRFPAWSPEGETIAFVSNREGPFTIYVMQPDGSEVEMLSDARASKPKWSPDGSAVAFHAFNDDNSSAVYILELIAPEE